MTPWVNDCGCEDEIAQLPAVLGLSRGQSLWFLNDANEPFAVSIHDFLNAVGRTDDMIQRAKDITVATMYGTLVSIAPFVKYPKGSNYAGQYPKLTEYLKNQLPKVAFIPKIVDAIHEFTQLPINQIRQDLQWDNGPILEVVQLDDYPDCSTCNKDTVGYFDRPNNPDRILLDIDYGNLIKNDNDAAIFFIGTTILHEYVHWGENSNEDFIYYGEEGVKFEIKAYGQNVQPENARLILNRL